MGKKKVKPGAIEAHPDAVALNVHYTEEVTDDDTGKVRKRRRPQHGVVLGSSKAGAERQAQKRGHSRGREKRGNEA